jgi:hypothetical protein
MPPQPQPTPQPVTTSAPTLTAPTAPPATCAGASLLLTLNQGVSGAAASGYQGAIVSYQASNLDPNAPYNLFFGTQLVSSGTPMTTATGAAMGSFTVPSMQPGAYTVTIASPTRCAQATFTIPSQLEPPRRR